MRTPSESLSRKYPVKAYFIGPRLLQFEEDCELLGVIIPRGYITNGATVPRVFWWILSPFTEGLPAAVVHDFRHADDTTWKQRADADAEFYHNLRECGLSFTRSAIAYLAVRSYAHLTWWTWK